jgi:mono/diheme cytochrome c family protein
MRIAALLSLAALATVAQEFTFRDAQALMRSRCIGCHSGKEPSGKLDLARAATLRTFEENPRTWQRIFTRVRDGDMPPQQAPTLDAARRERFVQWIDSTLRTTACADGIAPGPAPLRRLNRAEYAATVRDLLNIHFNAGQSLPADGAGGEGFDNAAETLFLSPIHAEKYLEAARQALEYGASDPRSRTRFLVASPNADTSPEQAARKIIDAFLPRAFRRPALPGEAGRYLALFENARQRGESFDHAVIYALQAVLMSPHFLFRLEEPNSHREPRLAGDYEIASRLSYFLWGTMPDQTLFDLAAAGKLSDPAELAAQVPRMLKDQKSLEFVDSFVEQWLGTRELGRDVKPDAKLFPAFYDAEIQSALRYEPILFFQEILVGNLSLLNLIDSRFSVFTNKLARHYGYEMKGLKQQPAKVDLPENSRRGGLLGMGAIMAVSSLPHRTSPVLRGKWVLDALLGTPPPPPLQDVPPLPDNREGEPPRTLRERLMEHRRNPVCGSCHNRIDPLGFPLEHYDVLGRWRETDEGRPIDAAGVLPDGARFDGPDQMKAVLMERKELLLRNLASKMLAYALGRGLILEDTCTVDRIVEALAKENYAAQTLIREIVLSVPFRYRAGSSPNVSVTGTVPPGYDSRKQEARPR